jgi:hypothetical protein
LIQVDEKYQVDCFERERQTDRARGY